VQSPMEQLTQQLVARNTRYGQDARTALGNWGAQHDIHYGDAETNARGAQAFSQQEFQGRLASMLSELQRAQLQRELEFASALAALADQRGSFMTEYAQGLADRDADRNLRQAELAQRAAIAQAQLDAEAARFNASQGVDPWEREQFYARLGLDTRKQDF